MYIHELELYQCRWFALSDIESIKIDVVNDINLILGTNGSGKSALLNLCNPLPGNSGDFGRNGHKLVKLTHQGQEYHLSTVFKSGGTHSFKRVTDGVSEELNLAGTSPVQKELVESIFGYTDRIHRVLTGRIRITQLSPGARKDLLMSINPCDLEYVQDLYERVRGEGRNVEGALQHVSNKKRDVVTQLSELNIPEDVESQVSSLEAQAASLMPLIKEGAPSTTEMENTLKAAVRDLDEGVGRLSRLTLPHMGNLGVKTYDGLNDAVGVVRGRIQSIKEQLDVNTDRIMTLKSELGDVDPQDISRADLESRIAIVEAELTTLGEEPEILEHGHEAAIQLMASVMRDLSDHVRSDLGEDIPSDSDYQTLLKQIESIQETMGKYRGSEMALASRVRHIESDIKNSVVCPRCEFVITREGVDLDELLVMTRKDLEKTRSQLACLESKLNDSLELRGQMDSIRKTLRAIRFITDKLSDIPDVGLVVPPPETLIRSTAQLSISVTEVTHRLIREQRRKQLSVELCGHRNTLAILDSTTARPDTELRHLESLEATLFDQLDSCQGRLDELMQAKMDYDRYGQTLSMCNELVIRLERIVSGTVEAYLVDTVRQDLNAILAALGKVRHMESSHNEIQRSITDLTQDIEQLTERKSDLSVLQALLSPNTGIIADEMLAFLKSFTDQMNATIERLWNYDFRIVPGVSKKGAVDYRFIPTIQGQTGKDISQLSTGQMEVVDLAFIMVMRAYLGLEDYPMYLDETGSGFDEAHRGVLFNYIKELTYNQLCSQVFMVNHYAGVHGGLTNHSTIVMDHRNIAVPEHHNQHVEIKRGSNHVFI